MKKSPALSSNKSPAVPAKKSPAQSAKKSPAASPAVSAKKSPTLSVKKSPALSAKQSGSYYKQIAGVKYDKGLLEMAEAKIKGQGDGRISKADAEELWEEAQDGKGVTECEERTLQYILDTYKCSEAGRKALEARLSVGEEGHEQEKVEEAMDVEEQEEEEEEEGVDGEEEEGVDGEGFDMSALVAKAANSMTSGLAAMATMRAAPKVTGLQSGLPKGSALTSGIDGLTERKGEFNEEHLKQESARLEVPKDVKKRKVGPGTTGKGWFDMPEPTMTPELKQDLQVIQMRNYLDPKKHMRTNDWAKKTPKYFQVGTVVDDASEFYSGRIPKKQRHDRMVDAVLADTKTKAYVKRAYTGIQAKSQEGRKKHMAKKKQARYKKAAQFMTGQ